jgi:aspartate carbamoyltransferase catalytic subunit
VPEDKKINIGIIGVPSRMRTVRSLLLFLAMYPRGIREIVIITDENEAFSEGQLEELQSLGLNIRVSKELDTELPNLDVVYINAIAWVGDSFETHGATYKLDADSPLKPGAIVLHPLARGDELSIDLDDTPHNWYFAQARGAVFIRMALLTTLSRRINQVMEATS